MVQFAWMIAEFANYRSWIAWVPIVGLLAVPLLFRRVLAVSLAAVGALIGLAIGAARSGPEPRDASVIVVGSAIGAGVVGTLIGGFGPALLAGAPPDLNVTVLATVAVGGGVGWATGASIGWRRARTAPAPGAVQRGVLVVAAVSIAIFGAVIVATIQGHRFGPSIDEMTRAERDSLPLIAAVYCIDVAIAVSTLVAVAARGTGAGRPRASVPGSA
jgi:hypothetical protein